MSMTARIGLLIPSSNSSVEPEFYRALPPDVTLHTARLFLSHINEASLQRMIMDIDAQSQLLATADVDVIMLGAVTPGWIKGASFDKELSARIAAASGKRASTTATALNDSLRHLGVTRIAVGGPYDKAVSDLATRFLGANGFEVVGTGELGLQANLEVGRLSAEPAYDMGVQLARDYPQAQAIVFAGTNWGVMPATQKLEDKIGKPVVSSTAAAMWQALRMVGWRGKLAGQGKLLSDV